MSTVAADRKWGPSRGRRGATRVISALVVASVVGTAGFLGVRSRMNRSPAGEKKEDRLVVTTTAERQDLVITVSQTGVVAAKNSTPVAPELSGLVQWVSPNGIIVSRGDTILRLDPTQVQEQVLDLTVRYQEALLRQAQADAVGRASMQENRLRLQRARDQETAFHRQQEATLGMAEESIKFDTEELERQREDAEATRRLAAKGYVPGTDVERREAALKASEFGIERATSNYQLSKSEAASEAIDRERAVNWSMQGLSRSRSRSSRQVRMSGNEVENLQLQLERAQADLGRTTIAAPASGLLVLVPQGGWRGEVRVPEPGDFVSQGREVAEIVSLDRLQVNLELDQRQITGVRMHQPAEVVIDARPGEVLKGQVTAIGQTARRPPVQGWQGMSSSATFPVTVELPPTGKALIRPGMRASVRLVARRIEDVVVVPSGCIFQRDGKHIVYAQRNGRFTAVEVSPGESNGDYTAITSGLAAGERIALNDLGTPPPSGAAAPAGQEGQQ